MIKFLLFDLDNTLYPASSGLDREIDRLMTVFVSEYLGIQAEEAHRLRKTDAIPYGTTLQWLRLEYGFHDMERYFAAVHPANIEEYIPFDPGLPAMLEALPFPKAVLTNSPMEHAARVLRCLGIEDHFPFVFDIRSNGFRGKPYPEAYFNVLSKIEEDIQRVLFIDDMPRYLVPFRDLGGQSLLVDERGVHGDAGLPAIRRITELESYLSGKDTQGVRL